MQDQTIVMHINNYPIWYVPLIFFAVIAAFKIMEWLGDISDYFKKVFNQ